MKGRKLNPSVWKAWDAAVQTHCAQNGPVELVPFNERGDELPLVRARLLAVDKKNGGLVVEKPAASPQAEVLRKGVTVEVYLVSASTRMKAKSAIVDLGRFALNKHTKVMAFRLAPVSEVASAQRRCCFRLDTAGIAMPPVKLTHANWPEDKPPLQAKLIDISDRGVGLTARMDLELAETMKDQQYTVTIQLPDEAKPLELTGRVVRAFESAYRTVTLGMQFEFTTASEQRRVENTVQQFSAAQQRKQLRRLRGAG